VREFRNPVSVNQDPRPSLENQYGGRREFPHTEAIPVGRRSPGRPGMLARHDFSRVTPLFGIGYSASVLMAGWTLVGGNGCRPSLLHIFHLKEYILDRR
jgi:hypothetical protein